MRSRTVTKASLSALGAVLITFLVAISVADGNAPARKTAPDPAPQTASVTLSAAAQPRKPTLIAAPAPRPGVTLLLPRKTATADSGPAALLPVVAQADIHPDQAILANDVLERLPSLCRDNLKNFYVLYQGATSRGLGGKTTIILDGNEGANEFVGLMVHECGHVIHGNLAGDSSTGPSGFADGSQIFAKDSPAAAFFAISWMTPDVMKAGQTNDDFVSGYAKTNCFEDFAETFTAYVLERPWMEERAKTDSVIAAKLQWMQTYLPLPENLFGTGEEKWTGTVPWDATKLAYVWNPIAVN